MRPLNIQDLQQLYQNSLVMYKNKPVKVLFITKELDFSILDLITQKTKIVKWSNKDFSPISRRLGMVNHLNSVFYVTRKTMRQYHIGITNVNTQFIPLPVSYDAGGGREVCKQSLMMLDKRDLADCLFNIYPSFEEALDRVTKVRGAVAFDKQFAIDHFKSIYYRTTEVGVLPARKKKVEDIQWDPNYEYCQHIIGNNYEKALGNLRIESP